MDNPLCPQFREIYSVLDQWEDSEILRRRGNEAMPDSLIEAYERAIIVDAQRILDGRPPRPVG